MAFFDGVKGKFNQARQTAEQKAKEFTEVSRLNLSIADMEKQINGLYREIGQKICETRMQEPLPEVAALMAQAAELISKLDAARAQVRAINDINICPSCGAKVTREAAFCSSCGQKLTHPDLMGDADNSNAILGQDDPAGSEQYYNMGGGMPPEPPIMPEPPRVYLCTSCGSLLLPDATFCPNCGTPVAPMW